MKKSFTQKIILTHGLGRSGKPVSWKMEPLVTIVNTSNETLKIALKNGLFWVGTNTRRSFFSTKNWFSDFRHGEKKISKAFSYPSSPLLNSQNAAKCNESYFDEAWKCCLKEHQSKHEKASGSFSEIICTILLQVMFKVISGTKQYSCVKICKVQMKINITVLIRFDYFFGCC